MLHILLLNKQAVESRKVIDQLVKITRKSDAPLKKIDNDKTQELVHDEFTHLTEFRLKRLQKCLELTEILVSDTEDRLRYLAMNELVV